MANINWKLGPIKTSCAVSLINKSPYHYVDITTFCAQNTSDHSNDVSTSLDSLCFHWCKNAWELLYLVPDSKKEAITICESHKLKCKNVCSVSKYLLLMFIYPVFGYVVLTLLYLLCGNLTVTGSKKD